MRLIIERDGGFTVIESDDVQDINVRNDGVDIVRRDGDSIRLERDGHAASVALATAIAVKCGVLVEPLAAGPDEVTASDGRGRGSLADSTTVSAVSRAQAQARASGKSF